LAEREQRRGRSRGTEKRSGLGCKNGLHAPSEPGMKLPEGLELGPTPVAPPISHPA
jgi:hypothetical protein